MDGLAKASILDIDGVAVPSGVAPPLDMYTGAAAAFSVRLLRTAYAGNCMEVRRASDGTTQNIGFVDGDVDTASITSFCSGTDGFVRTWFDQSGNGLDAVQTTTANQPKIYDSTTGIVTESTRPALDFGSSGFYDLGDNADTTTHLSVFGVGRSASVSFGSCYFSKTRAGVTTLDRWSSGHSLSTWRGNQATIQGNAAGAYHLMSIIAVDNTSHTVWRDGVQQDTDTTLGGSIAANSYHLLVGAYGNTGIGDTYETFGGPMQEAIYYIANQTANRANIEINLGAYYGITV